MFIPDNYTAFEVHDARCAAYAKRLPVCCSCGETIFAEHACCVDGDWYCSDAGCESDFLEAVKEQFMKTVEVIDEI